MEGLRRLEAKLDKMDEQIGRIDKTLDRNTLSLEEHIRRTNLLEKELKPVKEHVQFVNAAAKVLAGGGSVLLFARHMGWL